MPGNNVRAQSNPKSFKVNNWTAGIVSQDYGSAANGQNNGGFMFNTVPNASQQVTSSPWTYGCMGLPNGGLLLGPTVYTVTNPILDLTGYTSPIITGVLNNVGSGVDSDLGHYLIVNVKITGTPDTVDSVLYYMSEGGLTTLSKVTSLTGYALAYWNSIALPFATVLNPAQGSFYVAIVWTAGTDVVWYSPSGPGGDSGNFGVPGGVFAIPADGRVWGIGEASNPNNINNLYPVGIYYNNPTSYTSGDNYTWSSGSGLNPAIIDFDYPELIAAWGMITNSEMLLVKISEGAVLVTGDIFSATVTKLPQVRGTDGLFGEAEATPLGLVYRSNNNGVWVWNGGSTAQKLSSQLSDSVWPEAAEGSSHFSYVYPSGSGLQAAGQNPGLDAPNPYPIFNATYANDKIYFDGGWIYDLVTNSWWRLPPYADDGNVGQDWTYSAPFCPIFYTVNHNRLTNNGGASFPCPVSALWFDVTGNTTDLYSTNYAYDVAGVNGGYDFTPPTGFYHSYWESNPIQLPQESTDTYIEIQEIIVTMQGVGKLSVAVTQDQPGPTNFTNPQTQDIDSLAYGPARFIARMQTDKPIIKLAWDNKVDTVCTPIIEQIEIKYVERFPVPVAV